MTVSPSGAVAAIESESLPPSHATRVRSIASRSDRAAVSMSAPSAPILAAYIQLTDALMSPRAVMGAQTRLVRASARARRAMAAGIDQPFDRLLPDRRRCARHALKVARRDSHVSQRQLQRPHTLLAGHQPRDGAVHFGGEEAFGADRRQAQHAVER